MLKTFSLTTIALALGVIPSTSLTVKAQDAPAVLPPIVQADQVETTEVVEAVAVEEAPQAESVVQPVSETPAPVVMESAPVVVESCNTCDPCQKPAAKPNPCVGSHKGLFYANNFSYLNKPGATRSCLGDCLKERPVGPCGKLSLGGQMRWRYHNEIGMGQQAGFTRFQNTENQFLLGRLRLYADWKVNNRLRVFAEGIYADVISRNNDYVKRGIDTNQGDFLNLFADINVDDRTTVRIGRQELLYGAQRLVSPLDWSNTRRRFDGVKTMSKFENFNLDTWYTQFVPVQRTDFDTPNDQLHFWGAYATLTQLQDKTLDLYYLGLNDDRGPNQTAAIHTFGSRLQGTTCNKLLYELESMVQTGSYDVTDQSYSAYALTGGVGYQFANACWKPTLWFFYDYATGDEPGGSFNRFNDLFPLGHKYLGFIDAVQRRNILSPNVRLTMKPTKKTSLLFWYHNFQSAVDSDQILSLGGTPNQNLASSDFGNELDIVASYNVNARNSVLAGYSHFWRGSRIIGDTDADFFYMQWTTNF